MQKFTPLWRRFMKKWAEIENIKKSDIAVFQSAPYPRICRTLVLGIGRENHYRLSEHISRLIIDCTIEMYVPLTLTSEVIKNAQYLTMY